MTNKIMIAEVVPDSPCDIDGRLKVGDQILEVTKKLHLEKTTTALDVSIKDVQ